MSKLVSLLLPWPPTVNTYWRHVVIRDRAVTLLSSDARKYRDAVIAAVLIGRLPRHVLTGKLSIDITAYPPDRRARDLDNLPKGILDSLKHAGVIRDDCDIDELHIRRSVVRPGGEVSVVIAEIVAMATTSGELFAKALP